MRTLTIFPNTLLLQQAVRKQAKKVFFLEDVTTLSHFLSRLIAELPGTKTPLLPEEKLFLLKETVRSYCEQYPNHFFASVAQTEGFLEHLQKWMSECKKALLSPEKILALAKENPKKEERARLEALGLLYAMYQQKMQQHIPALIDRDDEEKMLVSALGSKNWKPRILEGVQRLHFYALTTLTPLRFAIFKALAERLQEKGGEVALSIVYDPEYQEGIFRFSGYTLTNIEALGSVCHAIDPPDFFSTFEKRGEGIALLLQKLAERYPYVRSREGSKKKPVVEAMQQQIHFIEEFGIVDEVEAVAREIRSLMQKGTAPDEMIVVVRDLSVYGEIVEEVFARWKIPLTFRRGKPLLSSPLIRALLSVYFFLCDPLNGDALLRVVTSGYKVLPKAIPAEQLAKLLRQCKPIMKTTDFLAAREQWQQALHLFQKRAKALLEASDADRHERRKAKQELACAQSCLPPLKAFFEQIAPLSRLQTVAAHVDGFLEILHAWQVERFLQREATLPMARDRMGWRMLLATLETLKNAEERIGAAHLFSLREFFSLLLGSLKEKTIAFRQPLRGVWVLKPNDMIGMEARTVFLLGLTAEHFPKRYYESPLLPETLKAWVNEALSKEEKPFVRRAFMSLAGRYLEEAFFFFLSIQAAQEKLFLSRYLMDATETRVGASPYFQTVEAIVHRKDKEAQIENRDCTLENCSDGLSLLAFLAPFLLRQTDLRKERSKAKLVLATLLHDAKWGKAAKRLEKTAKMEQSRSRFFLMDKSKQKNEENAYCGVCSSPKSHQWIREKLMQQTLSPTVMETYGLCPFPFLVNRLLNISLEEEPTDEMDSLMTGSFYHAVLERFFREKRERGEPFFSLLDRENVEKVLESVSEEWKERYFTGIHPLLFVLKKEETLTNLLRSLKQIREAYREYRKVYRDVFDIEESLVDGVEVVFKKGKSLGVVAVQDEKGTASFAFQGRIDAVFVSPDKKIWEVVDFKATQDLKRYTIHFYPEGDKKRELENLGIVGWQLPIYALAVKNAWKGNEDEKRVLGVAYWALKGENEKKTALRCRWDEKTEAIFRKNAVATLERVLQGKFEVSPVDPSVCCSYCPCRRICRHPEAMEGKRYG